MSSYIVPETLETKPGVCERILKFNSSEIFKHRNTWRAATSDPPPIRAEFPISLVIINNGNAIALWYAISINIQLDTTSLPFYIDWTEFYETSGDHWQINHAELDRHKRFEAMFMSNGTLASYPKWPLKVCKMNTGWFLEEISPTKECQIFFTIVTDRGPKKQGLLKLVFQPETT